MRPPLSPAAMQASSSALDEPLHKEHIALAIPKRARAVIIAVRARDCQLPCRHRLATTIGPELPLSTSVATLTMRGIEAD
jgi:hypothetical protein